MPGSLGLLKGQNAVVTGGAGGLGRQIVRRFAEEGATGVVFDKEAPDEGLPSGWRWLAVEVEDDGAIREAFASVGDIEIVVAAAGIVPAWQTVVDADLEEWERVLRVNVLGTFLAFRHALPHMDSGGAIVAIGSVNSWRGDPNVASYVASKHAVLGLVRSTALAAGPRGIRVNAVGPGPIATDALLARMAERERRLGISVEEALAGAARQTALGRIAAADEVASAVLFLASAWSAGITGQLLRVDGGIL